MLMLNPSHPGPMIRDSMEAVGRTVTGVRNTLA